MDKRNLKIGDVIWVNLHEYGKHIQSGVRPAIIIQNNKGNYYSPTIQIVPLTSKNKTKLPTHVRIPAEVAGLPKDSTAQCEGIRPVSKVDILGYIGSMPDEYMEKIAVATIKSTPVIQYISPERLQILYEQITTAI